MAGIDALAGLLTDIVGEFNQGQEKTKTLEALENIQKNNLVSQGVYGGEQIMGDLSNEGLPGYEGMIEEQKALLPTTVDAIKRSANTGELMGTVSNLYAKQNESLRELQYKNAQEKLANKKGYANYLGTTLGGAQERVNDNNMQLGLGKIFTQQQANKGSMGWLSGIFSELGNLSKSINPDGSNITPQQATQKFKFTAPQNTGMLDFSTPDGSNDNSNIFGQDKMSADESKDFNSWANLTGY